MKIKITKGTASIRKYRKDNVPFFMAVTSKDGVIDVEESQAKRLIDLGVAVAVESSLTAESEEPAEAEPEEAIAEDDEKSLSDMTVDELKKYAAELGISLSSRAKKQEIIDAISEAEETVEDDELMEGPVLNASGLVV